MLRRSAFPVVFPLIACLLPVVLFACGKGGDGGPKAGSPAGSGDLEWRDETVLGLYTYETPVGPGWQCSFDMSWHGDLTAPDVVFAVRSGGEVKRMLEDSAAVSKGATDIAGLGATLYEGEEKDWGPIRIWVLDEKTPDSGEEVGVIASGRSQAGFTAELERMIKSLRKG